MDGRNSSRTLSRRWLAPTVALSLGWLGCTRSPEPPQPSSEITRAVDRSMRWLAAHPPDPATDAIGVLTLDAMAWFVLAELHPDDTKRLAAGEQLDRRLRGMPLPAEPTLVALSYWSTVLEMMSLRGLDLTRHGSALADWDLQALIDQANPTTAFWIGAMLHEAGLRDEPDRAGTLLATGAALPPEQYEPSTADAYRLFHELVPLTGMTRKPTPGL